MKFPRACHACCFLKLHLSDHELFVILNQTGKNRQQVLSGCASTQRNLIFFFEKIISHCGKMLRNMQKRAEGVRFHMTYVRSVFHLCFDSARFHAAYIAGQRKFEISKISYFLNYVILLH